MKNPFGNWTEDQWNELRLQDKERFFATASVHKAFEKGASYRNNKMPVFSGLNTPFAKETPAIIDVLEEVGVAEFAWTSNASNFQEVLWIFNEQGYVVNGMVRLEYVDVRLGTPTVLYDHGLYLQKQGKTY